MSHEYDPKIAKLRKLLAVAERPEGNEAEADNARRMLHKFLAEYGLTLDDLNADAKPAEVKIEYGFDRHKREVIIMCGHNLGLRLWEQSKKPGGATLRYVVTECTKAQYVELLAMVDFYLRAFEQEFRVFIRAFIGKNDLWSTKADSEDREPTAEEMERAARAYEMQRGIKKHNFHKQLDK